VTTWHDRWEKDRILQMLYFATKKRGFRHSDMLPFNSQGDESFCCWVLGLDKADRFTEYWAKVGQIISLRV